MEMKWMPRQHRFSLILVAVIAAFSGQRGVYCGIRAVAFSLRAGRRVACCLD